MSYSRTKHTQNFINKMCNYCKEVFFATPGQLKRGRGRFCSRKCKDNFQIGKQSAFSGKKHTAEANQKNRLAHLGSNNANFGRKLSRETIKKILHRRPLSKLELKTQSVINKYNLPYKFVGNGKFFIENINPDFININGEKKALEVYWEKHKIMFRNKTIQEWRSERIKIANKYGWKMLFLEASDFSEQNIINLLNH